MEDQGKEQRKREREMRIMSGRVLSDLWGMVVLLAASSVSLAATYHVDWDTGNDAHDGSQAKPWKTPWCASGKDSPVAKPGDAYRIFHNHL